MPKQPKPESYDVTATHLAQYHKFLADHLQAGIRQLKAKHPDFDERFMLRTQVQIHKKQPPAYYRRVIDQIMMHLLREGGPSRTQKIIIQDVQKALPEYNNIPVTLFQKDLKPWEKKRIKQLIDDRMGRAAISIRECKELSQIKERLEIAEQVKNGARVIKATVRISDDMVSVGNASYSIDTKKSAGGYEYPSIRVPTNGKRPSLRVDALVSLLEG
jgi:hypothetical protein